MARPASSRTSSVSAGFASISKILRVPRYYAMTDAVVLLAEGFVDEHEHVRVSGA